MLLPYANRPNSSLLEIEFGLTAIGAVSAFGWPTLAATWFNKLERQFARVADRKGLAIAVAALSVILLRLAILPIYGIPLPFVPDDFSFLLAADTFAHGRLTNPTPAMWTHFESIHITMVPSYQSMYFPGEGLLLAAGQLLGHPWFGLLIMDGLMCAALTWMLQAWLPRRWALLGGLIAVIRLGLFSDWINTYHAGGSLSALGGALVLGALPRLKKTARFRYGMLMGIGMTILALTRPYEGMLLCLPVVVALGHWVWKGENRPPAAVLLRRAAAPIAVLVLGLAWLGYYDLKAFGNPTTLPYTLDRAEYATAPYYIWQHQRPEPHYRFAAMRDFYRSELRSYVVVHSIRGFIPQSIGKVGYAFLYYAGFTLILPLIMIRRVLLDRRVRFLIACMVVLAGGMAIEIFSLPHYLAPFAAAFYAIGLQLMRHLRVWKPEGRPVGLQMVRMSVLSCIVLAGVRLFAQPLHIAQSEWPPGWNCVWSGPEHFGTERAQIEENLQQLPGQQLVIVRYAKNHNPLDEWVYNEANLNQSKIIWARDMDAADNLKLIHYYHNRQVWLVEPDAVPARIVPYPEASLLRASR